MLLKRGRFESIGVAKTPPEDVELLIFFLLLRKTSGDVTGSFIWLIFLAIRRVSFMNLTLVVGLIGEARRSNESLEFEVSGFLLKVLRIGGTFLKLPSRLTVPVPRTPCWWSLLNSSMSTRFGCLNVALGFYLLV